MIRLQSEEYRYQTTRLMIAAKELPHPVPTEEPSLAEPATRELSAILHRQLNGAWFVLTRIDNHSIDGWLPGDFWQFVNNPAEASLAGLLPHQPLSARSGNGDRPKGLVGSAIRRAKGLAGKGLVGSAIERKA